MRKRLERLDALLAEQAAVPMHGGLLSVDLTLDHLRLVRRADRDWLKETIARLEREMTESPEPAPSSLPQ